MKAKPSRKPAPAKAPFSIMLSKRANVLFIQHARVLQKDGRVLYLTQQEKGGEDIEHYFNIPHQNTMLLLLGRGTSITDSAARLLAEAGVMVGFTGSGGSPLVSAADVVFFPPQSEYRPTEYMQAWMRMWLDDAKRLSVAKRFLTTRLQWAEASWAGNAELGKKGIRIGDTEIQRFEARIKKATTTEELLSAEGEWVRSLYAVLAKGYRVHDFTRVEREDARSSTKDVVNGMLTHGNYIAYGFAAVALYALGISFALPVLHGKTRRGALVFDVADLFKDSTVLPLAFAMGSDAADDQSYRNALIDLTHKNDFVERAIDVLKQVA